MYKLGEMEWKKKNTARDQNKRLFYCQLKNSISHSTIVYILPVYFVFPTVHRRFVFIEFVGHRKWIKRIKWISGMTRAIKSVLVNDRFLVIVINRISLIFSCLLISFIICIFKFIVVLIYNTVNKNVLDSDFTIYKKIFPFKNIV